MALQKIPTEDSLKKFLASSPAKPNPKIEVFREIKAGIGQALAEPDGPYTQDTVPAQNSDAAAVEQADASVRPDAGVLQVNVPAQQQKTLEAEFAPPEAAEEQPVEDAVSMEAPTVASVVTKKRWRGHKAERSVTIHPEQDKMLTRLANLEGLRLERRVGASEILRHLIDFALAHVDMKTGEVIPTADGRGLVSPKRSA